jgi:hypothetical protein
MKKILVILLVSVSLAGAVVWELQPKTKQEIQVEVRQFDEAAIVVEVTGDRFIFKTTSTLTAQQVSDIAQIKVFKLIQAEGGYRCAGGFLHE